MDAADLNKIVATGAHAEAMAESSIDQPIINVQQNALPDVYPEEKK